MEGHWTGIGVIGLGWEVIGLGWEVIGLGWRVIALGWGIVGLGWEVFGLGWEVVGLGWGVIGLGWEGLSLLDDTSICVCKCACVGVYSHERRTPLNRTYLATPEIKTLSFFCPKGIWIIVCMTISMNYRVLAKQKSSMGESQQLVGVRGFTLN